MGWREAACRRNPSSASPPAWPSLPCFDYAASASPFLCSSPLRSLARRPPELELARAPASVAKHGADPLGAQARPAQGHGAGRRLSSARLAMDARAGRRPSSPWTPARGAAPFLYLPLSEVDGSGARPPPPSFSLCSLRPRGPRPSCCAEATPPGRWRRHARPARGVEHARPRPLLRAPPRRGPPPPMARPPCAGGGDERRTKEEERLVAYKWAPRIRRPRQRPAWRNRLAKPPQGAKCTVFDSWGC